MTTFRIDLAYLGGGFHGYASQPDVRTVQGELEAALAHHTGPVETFVSGRTDKGVHASAQVVSFSTSAALDPVRVVRSLNRQLAPEIAVLSMVPAPDDFHARFSATSRSYTYRLLNRAAPDPFLAATAWHFETPLDVDAMNAAAGQLKGEQDFASFCRRTADRSTVRDVREAMWHRSEHVLAFDVTASSFCHQMVRSFVALCVDVGRGRVPVEAVTGIVAAQDRHAARGAAPPHGLTMVRVEFGDVMPPSPLPA